MTQNLTKSWDELTELINESESILLSTHVNPDGDGLGSEIGFYYHLIKLGKECRIINPTFSKHINTFFVIFKRTGLSLR